MDSRVVERALVELIVDEMKRQRYTNRAMQEAAGIKPRTWSNYTSMRSPIPMDALYAIAEVLGLSGSQLMARAEARAATMDPIVEELRAGLDAKTLREIDDLERGRDPFPRHRADEDDGAILRTASAG